MKWIKTKDAVLRHTKLIAASTLLALALAGVIQGGVSSIGIRMSRDNDAFLDRSIESTMQLMVPVGVAKAAADVIEGSTAVVEWGDIAQPILDYLDVAWRILILSLIVTTATKHTLLGVTPLVNVFLVASLSLYFVLAVAHSVTAPSSVIRICVKRTAGLFLLVYLLFVAILPLAIYGTGQLSKTITEPLRAETFKSLEQVGAVFSLEAITQQDGFLDKMDAIKKKSVEIIRFCSKATADIASSVAKLAVIKVLDAIVFPLACLGFLIWLVRGSLYPALGLSDRSLARDDFRYIEGMLTKRRDSPL
ncbi:MAG: hypothetical protein PHO37_10765 [Kiritimatiellae bacterium]|nr:hypothetical protein [Kiritimatiellia bacterium]